MGCSTAGVRRVLRLSLADRFGMALSLGEGWSSPDSAAITLGGRSVALPGRGLLDIGGEVETVDLDGWIRLIIDQARAGRGLGGLTLETGTLGAAEMRFLDRRFEDVALSFSTAEDALTAEPGREAVLQTIDRLKEIVPVWKKEVGPNESVWVEGHYRPTEADN